MHQAAVGFSSVLLSDLQARRRPELARAGTKRLDPARRSVNVPRAPTSQRVNCSSKTRDVNEVYSNCLQFRRKFVPTQAARLILVFEPGAPGSIFYLGLGFLFSVAQSLLTVLLGPSSLCGCPRFDFLPGSWVSLLLTLRISGSSAPLRYLFSSLHSSL
jgi:hypothetical protein